MPKSTLPPQIPWVHRETTPRQNLVQFDYSPPRYDLK